MAETEGNRAAARHFGVNENNIRRWRKSLPSLQKQKKTQKALRTHSPGFPDLERLLLAGILERRQAGHAVSTTELRMRAVQVARTEFQIPESSFKASYGWAIKFMNRHGLSIRRRTTIGQRLPDAYEDQILEFQLFCIRQRHICDFIGQICLHLTIRRTHDLRQYFLNKKSAL